MSGALSKMGKAVAMALCLLALCFGMAACGGGKTSAGSEFEVIAAIDKETVSEENGFTRFTAVMDDGTPVRFEGIGITVTDQGLVAQPDAKLFSLDFVGQITSFVVQADAAVAVGWGFACADVPSVESFKNLRAAIVYAVGADSNKPECDVSSLETGFLALSIDDSNAGEIVLESLTLRLDRGAAQVLFSDIDPESEVGGFLTTHIIDWNEAAHTQVGISSEQLALQKIAEPTTLQSDIVANIDRGSITVEGNSTFFSSILADGSTVRFEGHNIEITDVGILLHPDSTVTSLDAIGKIFGYYPVVENWSEYDESDAENLAALHSGYGYTYSSSKTSVDRASQVHTFSAVYGPAALLDGSFLISTAAFDPNYVYFAGSGAYSTRSIVLTNLTVCYNPNEKTTAMVDAKLDEMFVGAYLEGERYDASRETSADLENDEMGFYLVLQPDTEAAGLADTSDSVWFVPKEFYEVGDLRNAQGHSVDKATALMEPGMTLEVAVGDSRITLPLDVLERYKGAQTHNDLVPYAYPSAVGTMNTLVVPVVWADQTNMANDDTLALIRERIGRIEDVSGAITDYSGANGYSLSSYFDLASYGELNIVSFMTDWYFIDKDFAENRYASPDDAYANEILEWVRATYPDLDWSKYDQDANGYVDSLVILNTGVANDDSYNIISYEGAISYRHSYYGDYAGSQEAPRANTYTTVGYRLFADDSATIVHEFSHGLGLIDYYDVMYSGINLVGGFDMQSDNAGDWNSYSKMSVGWLQPQVVEGLKSGESIELTIGSSALTDDVIVIPAAGKSYEGPFGEYVMIDLFTDDGANAYDTAEYGLAGVAGVRISHVDAAMEKRTMGIESKMNPGITEEYTIGTTHYTNAYAGSEAGYYALEVVQSGGINTFADPQSNDTRLSSDDLFYAGDVFDVEEYDQFFYEGRMDDGSAFGYKVEIVSIASDADGNPVATIRVTAK